MGQWKSDISYCFLVVADELHFARSAEQLHIEQSPLSRAIKGLEEDPGAQLSVRNTRSTRLPLLFRGLMPELANGLLGYYSIVHRTGKFGFKNENLKMEFPSRVRTA